MRVQTVCVPLASVNDRNASRAKLPHTKCMKWKPTRAFFWLDYIAGWIRWIIAYLHPVWQGAAQSDRNVTHITDWHLQSITRTTRITAFIRIWAPIIFSVYFVQPRGMVPKFIIRHRRSITCMIGKNYNVLLFCENPESSSKGIDGNILYLR